LPLLRSLAGLLKLSNDLLMCAAPVLLNYLVTFVSDPQAPIWQGWTLSSALLLSQLLQVFTNTEYNFRVGRVALRLRAATITLVGGMYFALSLTLPWQRSTARDSPCNFLTPLEASPQALL
jgi:hypothetical protein